jgi:hypothetical protein
MVQASAEHPVYKNADLHMIRSRISKGCPNIGGQELS